MRKYLLLTFIFLWTITDSFGQKTIIGKVLEQSSKKPIQYANIGILNSTVGTISNEDGSFSISIPVQHTKDTLLFSALGYSKRGVPVSLLSGNRVQSILLVEKSTELETITISTSKEKRKSYWLGNRYNKGGNIYADSIAAGSAMALLIENKYPAYHADLNFPVFIEKALLFINVNTLDEFKIRIRILEMDSITKLPGKDIFYESIIVTSAIKKGWLDFDLSSFNFKIDKPFFLVFEWILEDKARLALLNQYKNYKKLNPEKVTIDTMIVRGEKVPYYNWYNFVAGTSFGVSPIKFSLDNYQCYYRNNSFGEWRRAATILTARISVSNQPVSKKNNLSKSKAVKPETLCQEGTSVCESINICMKFIDENSINAIQLAVSVKGKTVLSKGFGYSDIATDEPVTTQTRFRIGSVSKSLTSAALIKLVAEGKLDLDAPVQRYVPSFPEKKYSITTRQLAGHLAGIRHYNENDLGDIIRKEHYNNATEAVSIFKNDSLVSKPGTQYYYSSYGWNLIGAIIEGASKENYLDYMTDKIWRPLTMFQTYGDVADSLMPNKSKFYVATGEEAEGYDLSYKYPSGGLLSTSEDLVKFGNELLRSQYFAGTMIKQLFETQYTNDDKPTNYGLGWNIVKDKNGHRIWYHSGQLLEGSAYLILYPDDDIVIAFLANSRESLSLDIQKIGELFYTNR